MPLNHIIFQEKCKKKTGGRSCFITSGAFGHGLLWGLQVYYWDEMTHSPHYDIQSGFTLMTFVTFVGPLAALGLMRGDIENAWDCFVVGNISANTWWLYAPAPVLLVLPQK